MASSRLQPVRLWPIVGPLATAVLSLFLELTDFVPWGVINPGLMLLTLVAFSSFYGVAPGMLSALIATIEFGRRWGNGPMSLQAIAEMAIVSAAMVVIVAKLRRRLAAREAEVMRLAQAEFLRSRLEQMLNGLEVVAWEADAQTWDFHFVGRAIEQILGYPVSHWLEGGKEFLAARVHPEDRGGVFKSCMEATSRGQSHEAEYRMIAADGRVVWVRDLVRVITDERGEPRTCYGVLVDITRQRQIEAELRESEQKFRVLAETAQVMICIIQENRFLYVNPYTCQSTGYSREDLMAMDPARLIHPDFRETVEAWRFRWQVGEAGARSQEFVFLTRQGAQRWVNGSLERIDFQGRPAVLAITYDITDRKAAEQQLRDFNEILERRAAERSAVAEARTAQLRAMASELTLTEQRERRRLAQLLHDHLQQLLVAAKLKLGLVLTGHDIPHHRELQQAHDLVDQTIAASRSLTMELSPPILYEMGLGAGLAWLARWMKEKHELDVQLDIQVEPEGLAEDVRVFLFTAVREALFNVIKHAKIHQAWVRTSALPTGHVQVEIEDHGAGFDPSVLESKVTMEHFGLFSIRERLQMAGGCFDIQSQPGHGTKVRLISPLPRPGYRPKPLPMAETVGGITMAATTQVGRVPSIRVVLADDHAVVREGLGGLLREQPDMEVVGEAANGLMAVELAHSLHPDVLVMDVSMPELDGVTATQRIHQSSPDVRVIGLSMHRKEDLAHAMRQAGAVAYLVKDGPADELISTIRACAKPSINGHRD